MYRLYTRTLIQRTDTGIQFLWCELGKLTKAAVSWSKLYWRERTTGIDTGPQESYVPLEVDDTDGEEELGGHAMEIREEAWSGSDLDGSDSDG